MIFNTLTAVDIVWAFRMRDSVLKSSVPATAGLALLVTLTGPAIANSGCYIRYPGQSQDLQSLCNGNGEDTSLQFYETQPVVQNVTVAGDFAQGRLLLGEIYNPHSTASDGVTLFYSVHTSAEIRTGTLVVSSLDANATEQIAVDLSDLRGQVERYELTIL